MKILCFALGVLAFQSAFTQINEAPKKPTTSIAMTGFAFGGNASPIPALYAATPIGVYQYLGKQHDSKWKLVGFKDKEIKMIAGNPYEMYAYIGKGVYRNNSQSGELCGIKNTDLLGLGMGNNKVYASTEQFLYESSDAGKSWTKIEGAPIQVTTIYPRDSKTLIIGTYWKGVYRTDDGGKTWTNCNLNNRKVKAVYSTYVSGRWWIYALLTDGLWVSPG